RVTRRVAAERAQGVDVIEVLRVDDGRWHLVPDDGFPGTAYELETHPLNIHRAAGLRGPRGPPRPRGPGGLAGGDRRGGRGRGTAGRDEVHPLWSRMSFSAAEENFHVAAQHGIYIDVRVYWPGIGEVSAIELVLRRLLPLAYEGLSRWGVGHDEAARLLSIIEQRGACCTVTAPRGTSTRSPLSSSPAPTATRR
ncbi:hypothetical protein QBC39DRAFT_418474, partial [Podospora conica]